jgi:hypothetical protein
MRSAKLLLRFWVRIRSSVANIAAPVLLAHGADLDAEDPRCFSCHKCNYPDESIIKSGPFLLLPARLSSSDVKTH